MDQGENSMTVLKSYTCSKCAGILIFDSDQEFFDCPFCGTKFNAVDFHGDEILDQAKDCLKKRSFDAAKDKYLIVLDNDPQNFDALLGIVFCELKISSAEELNDRSVLLNRDLIPAKKALINAKRQLPKNEADYFDKIMDLIGLHEKITKYEKRKIELLSSNAAQISINNKLFNPIIILKGIISMQGIPKRNDFTIPCLYLFPHTHGYSSPVIQPMVTTSLS